MSFVSNSRAPNMREEDKPELEDEDVAVDFWRKEEEEEVAGGSCRKLVVYSSPLRPAQESCAGFFDGGFRLHHHHGRHAVSYGWLRDVGPATAPALFLVELNLRAGRELAHHVARRTGARVALGTGELTRLE
eukprot:CAMPEP_0178989146 /NCGR_PEP_ID=MMETSP0795-20121207/4200_1 /TAXON_ID=88552 /ORGANISM="Amoebophrya sp., Strain Ameob2" /LENGTH=131 /DNA_ID=CAMNT_0020680491 /DNA_START=406 /DNA_END=798 /DNA_ORIENTATION=-